MLLIASVMLSGIILAQEDSVLFKRNEFKLNLPMTIFVSTPEISYEYILQEDLSLGATANVNLGDENENTNFIVMPYARWFFGGSHDSMQKYAAGFFIEANVALVGYEKEIMTVPNTSKEDKVGLGAGVAIGWKYVTKNNWIGEIFFGGGKIFQDGGYPRIGITIGKRF